MIMKKNLKKILPALALIFVLSACSKIESHTSTGVIQEIKDGGKVMVIKHQEFPGFMEGMTMPFTLKNDTVGEGIQSGDQVKFTLEKGGKWYLVSEIEKIN
jgi:Cu/Ag efflux protein CusF